MNKNNVKRRVPQKRRQKNNKVVRYVDYGRFVADRSFLKLIWTDTTLTRQGAGSTNVLNFGIRSSAFDPDPAVLTGSIPGFVEMANLYAQYRVHKMKLRWTVSNNEPNGITIVAWPSNVLHNVNSLTSDDVLEYRGNIQGRSVMMGNNNSPPRTITTTADAMSLIGPVFKTDLDYASSTSANPTIMYALNLACVSMYGNFTYAVSSLVQVVYFVEFFERRTLET